MNVLLDTCALLILAGQTGRFNRSGREALSAASEVYVSPVTAWEIAIKAKVGKIHLSETAGTWFKKAVSLYDLREATVTSSLLCAAADLPLIHRDPFDRVLIATARANNLPILTSDQTIPTYPDTQTIW